MNGLPSAVDAFRDRWFTAVRNDPENRHIGRFSTFTVRLRSPGGDDVSMCYAAGELQVVDDPLEIDPPDLIELTATPATWVELADPAAPPLRHDLLALVKAADGIEITSGRLHLIRHLRVITRLVELAKETRGAA
jgi:hypothetical protein